MQLPVTRLVFLLIPRGSQRKRTGVGYVAPRIVGNISRLNHHPPSAAFETASFAFFHYFAIHFPPNRIFRRIEKEGMEIGGAA